MEPSQALQHWARWAVDAGNWRRTCAGIEKHYASNPERYVHPEDAEKRLRERYDVATGEKVEWLINCMPDAEKCAMRALYIHYPHLADEDIARRIGMSKASYEALSLTAHGRFGRMWREEHLVAA
jgi:hypothetical protein